MSYEYMMGMGQSKGSRSFSLTGRVGAGGGSNGGDQGTEGISLKLILPGLISAVDPPLKPVTPAGMVDTNKLTGERARIKEWIVKAFGTKSAFYKDGNSLRPSFKYVPGALLTNFRNAQLRVSQLGSLRMDPVAAAPSSLKAENAIWRRQFYDWWKRCHVETWAVWALNPGLARLVPTGIYTTFVRSYKNQKPIPCPGLSLRLRWFIPKNALTVQKLFDKQAVINERRRLLIAEQTAASASEQVTQKRQEADELRETVASLEAMLTEATQALDAARGQAATNGGVDNATLIALQAQVSELVGQISAANQTMAETRHQADLAEAAAEEAAAEAAEEAAAEAAEEAAAEAAAAIEESVFGRYKWHMAIGGFAAAGAGLLYYYFKYLPGKGAAPAPVMNPDDEEPVYDSRGRLLGTVWPAAVPGRWIARSEKMNRPLYSATSPERAALWLERGSR